MAFSATLLTVVQPLANMGLFYGQTAARSANTYVQSDLALHSPLLFCYFLSKKSHPMPFNRLRSDCVIVINLNSVG